MVDARDVAYMERAAFLAERGRGRTSPNPIVGAVIVSPSGIIVGQGAHLRAGGPHAEIVALDAAGSRARGATLYCTLEPCVHTGRTGPCVQRIVSDGIARVVYALEDPNPQVAGRGARFLRAHGVEVTERVGLEAARRQHAPFATWVTRRRPYVTLKAAISADGFVGRHDGPIRLTGPAADRFFHRQRAEVDAIAVGAGTVLTDDPRLTARLVYRDRPLVRVLFDWRLRIPDTARVFSTLPVGPVIMVVSAEAADEQPERLLALEARGIMVERRRARSVADVVEWLAARDIVTLLVEGGPVLHETFARAGLADRAQLVVTPKRLGSGVPLAPSLNRGGLWQEAPVARQLGDDRLIEWDVHGAD